MRVTSLSPSFLTCPSFVVEGRKQNGQLSFLWNTLISIGHYGKTPWWKNLQGCFRQKKEHEEKLAREEEDRQRNKEIWERVKRELQEDEQEAAKNWKATEVCANASLVDYMGHSKAKWKANVIVHNFRHFFLAWFFMPFHMVCTILFWVLANRTRWNTSHPVKRH